MEAAEKSIAEQLQAKVDAARECNCKVCAGHICGHEILFSIAMGQGDKPRCAACLALGMGKSTSQLRDHLHDHFQHRDCYGVVWQRESEREGFARGTLPGCLWAGSDTEPASAAWGELDAMDKPLKEPDVIGMAAEAWDAGEMACGELILALRSRLNALPAGTQLKVTAQDAGATGDIPAWCRMTGHLLLAQHHPHYWIQRKE